MNYFLVWGFFFKCTVSLTYLQKSCLIENIWLRHNLWLRHLKYMFMGASGDTDKKSTLISDSVNPKIDVLTGWSTLMPCFLLHHFQLQTSKTPEYSTCTGARKELELLTPFSFLPKALLRSYSEQHTGRLLLRTAEYLDNSFSVSSCPQQLYRLMES